MNVSGGMWLVTNLKTGERLLFKSITSWQESTYYAGWHHYSLDFVHVGF